MGLLRSARFLATLAGAGSAGLLLGALTFQYLGGLSPCPMCIWQRWPHLLSASLAVLFVAALPRRWVAGLGALAMTVSAGLGLFHAGVEQKWWEGPSTCSSGAIDGLSTEQLLESIMEAPMVRCDEIVWDFLGLTMAGWNAVASALLALLWIRVATMRR